MNVSEEAVEKIRRLYVEDGMTLVEVGTAVGLSKRSVLRVMVAAGIPRRSRRKRDQSGAANPRWKGAAAKYNALHRRVEVQRGKPSRCMRCGFDDPAARYEWANLTGQYDDLSDYERMCVPCHRRFDSARANPNPKRPGRARVIVSCAGCGRERPHAGRGLCGTCYTRRRRAAVAATAAVAS